MKHNVLSPFAILFAFVLIAVSAVAGIGEEQVLFEDEFVGGVSSGWSTIASGTPKNLNPAYMTVGTDSDGRPFLSGSGSDAAGLVKQSTTWKDYEVTFSYRVKQLPPDGGGLIRVIVRSPPSSVWGGYSVYLINDGGKFKIQANIWPTNPNVTTSIPVDTRWHSVSVKCLGDEVYAQLDNDPATRIGANDIYKASSFGGFAIGFTNAKWEMSRLRVTALRPPVSASDVLGRYCLLAYYPSLGRLTARVDLTDCADQDWAGKTTAVRMSVVREGTEKSLAKGEVVLGGKKTGETVMSLPKLSGGGYEVRMTAVGGGISTRKTFVRRVFPWEDNTLGITDKVYPPFTQVKVAGNDVNVVLRRLTMNHQGLWDRVVSENRDIMTGPMQLKFTTDAGIGKWTSSSGRFVTTKANKAVYQATSVADAVSIHTRSTIEEDGCMKVEMDLVPGKSTARVRDLWIDIPMKDSEAPLFFPQLEGCRSNYAGVTPRGGKIVWQPRATEWMLYPAKTWKSEPGPENGVIWTPKSCYDRTFAHYIWLGGPERGLAWFAENDRGWLIDPGRDAQEVVRDGDAVAVRLHLINRPSDFTSPRHIVFGLQASPTKPLPKDYRRNVAVPVHSGPCNGWGTFMCADKYPVDYDFSIVDELMKVRGTGKIDEEFFVRKNRTRSHQPALVHGVGDWLKSVQAEEGISKMYTTSDWIEKQGWMLPDDVKQKAINGPRASYFEEHCVNVDTPEWEVFQDEWNKGAFSSRQWKQMDTFMVASKPERWHMTNLGITVTRSYADFAVWYANEWMKRGVSLYLDNSMTSYCTDPNKSAAYVDEKGEIVPAVQFWSQRDYYKRLWCLRSEWNAKKPTFPITITHHVTNTQLLPFHTWVDKLTDLEWVPQTPPADPAFLLTETVARQTGNYADLVVGLTRNFEKSAVYSEHHLSKDDELRMEWGMRMVHEICRWSYPFTNVAEKEPASLLEKAVWDFGYGLPECVVQNYWQDNPLLAVGPNVKWLALVRQKDRRLMVVLQSYEPTPSGATIQFGAAAPSWTSVGTITDVSSREVFRTKDGKAIIPFDKPYGTRVVVLSPSSTALAD